MCIGDSVLPVRLAGQLSVQRPQTAHAKPSRSCREVSSSAREAPKLSAVSRSFGVDSVPIGSIRRMTNAKGAPIRWVCLENGM